MSWRIKGITLPITKGAGATQSRLMNQLIHRDANSLATTAIVDAKMTYPLIQNFDHINDGVAEVQQDGIANIFVEAAAGIVVGSRLAAGVTGVGVRLADDSEDSFAIALEVPTGNGDNIPAVMSLQKGTSTY